MKDRILIFIIFQLLSTINGQQLPITVYTPRNGALFSGANSIFQDHQGWMWFTNSYDVVRYDGHTFTTYPPASGSKLNACFKILQSGEDLWVVADPQVMMITGDSLTTLQAKNKVPDLISGARFNNQEYFLGDHGLYQYMDGGFTSLIADTSLQFTGQETLFPFGDSLLISYVWRQKLLLFDLKRKEVFSSPLEVNDICQHPDGRIFILIKGKGVFTLEKTETSGSQLLPKLNFYFLLFDPKAEKFEIDVQGTLWIGIQDSCLLKVLPDRSSQTYNESDGLPSLWFYSLFRDRESNIWIGMNNGLCKISNSASSRFTRKQGLSSNYISFLENDPYMGGLIIGTFTGTNYLFYDHMGSITYKGKPFICQDIAFSWPSNYFLRENELYKFTCDEHDFEITLEEKLTSLPGKGLQMDTDTLGTLFIATDHGLYIWKDGNLIDALHDNVHYHTLVIDRQQHLWMGSFSDKISVYKISYRNHQVNLIPILPSKQYTDEFNSIKKIRALAVDNTEKVYAGTRYNGVYGFKINNGSIYPEGVWTEDTGLNSNSIWGIATTNYNDAWIATARGVNRIAYRSGKVSEEGLAEGIYQSSYIFWDGWEVWVGTHPGIVRLDKQVRTSSQFNCFITNVAINGVKYPGSLRSGQRTTFPYNRNNITIDFSSNTYFHEEDVRYTYRLVKNNKGDWSELYNTHSVTYPVLSPGSYLFEVKSINNAGQWNSESATFSFSIIPPFWMRTWFRSVLIISFLILMYILYKYRIRQLMKLQEMRNNISRNLHDDIGGSLSNINILNTLTMRHLNDPARAESYLTQAGEDIQRISESLSDIVWNINPLNDDLSHLFSHMKRYAADMLEGKNIESELQFPPPGSRTHLSMEKRRDFFLIFKEAINNMAKYSNATKAKVALEEFDNSIHMLIEDNGTGFNMDTVTEGNGLNNMRQRAKNRKAKFQIESEPGKGTRISLQMDIS